MIIPKRKSFIAELFRVKDARRLTLPPDAFRCLIIATEDILVPVPEDLVHHASCCIFDIAGDIVQACSIVALECRTMRAERVVGHRTNLNETDSSFVAQGTLDENVAVMIDPSFGRQNVVYAHRALVPRDGLVEFRKDECIQRIGKDF